MTRAQRRRRRDLAARARHRRLLRSRPRTFVVVDRDGRPTGERRLYHYGYLGLRLVLWEVRFSVAPD